MVIVITLRGINKNTKLYKCQKMAQTVYINYVSRMHEDAKL